MALNPDHSCPETSSITNSRMLGYPRRSGAVVTAHSNGMIEMNEVFIGSIHDPRLRLVWWWAAFSRRVRYRTRRHLYAHGKAEAFGMAAGLALRALLIRR